MEKEIKRLDRTQTEAMFKLASYAFNKEPSVDNREYFARLADHSWNYGVFVDDKLASQVMCTPFAVNYFGTEYKMGGIGYVASYPEYRGLGGITDSMKMILEDMKKDGFALSYLAPFSYEFYRRFGYEQVFENIVYRVTRASLPQAPKKGPGHVKRLKLRELGTTLQDLYAKSPTNQRGGMVRMEWWWHYILNKKKGRNYAVYYNEAGDAEGYVIYDRAGSTFKVIEWIYLNVNSFKSLARFILSHESAFADFVYLSPNSEHSLSYLLKEPNVEVTIEPYMMARIVDFEIFLKDFPFVTGLATQDFYLAVTDDFAEWNTGIWHLHLAKGKKATIKKVSTDVTDPAFADKNVLSGKIQEWVQLFMGFRRPGDLAFYGRVSGPVELFNALEYYLPRGLPTLVDYF